MSNDEDIEVDAGIEEAIAGGMFKAIKSSNYMKTLLAVSAAFKKVDHELWKQHYDEMYKMLNQTADEFPLKLPSDLNLDQMANFGGYRRYGRCKHLPIFSRRIR